MKKSEFVKQVAARSGMTQKDTEHILDAIFCCLGDVLAEGERLTIPGFGTFDTKQRAARTGHIPSTGASISIPAATVPVFKPAKQLKEKLNQ
ncbi:MAG: HU family DNA-binding protein [Eubacteriales bacterium]|nr:HU family DNA-binding protein [Eubacteriales bacterium]